MRAVFTSTLLLHIHCFGCQLPIYQPRKGKQLVSQVGFGAVMALTFQVSPLMIESRATWARMYNCHETIYLKDHMWPTMRLHIWSRIKYKLFTILTYWKVFRLMDEIMIFSYTMVTPEILLTEWQQNHWAQWLSESAKIFTDCIIFHQDFSSSLVKMNSKDLL